MKADLLGEIAAEFQDIEMPAERLARAAAIVAPMNEKIAVAALARLGFDDNPADFAALLARPAPRR